MGCPALLFSGRERAVRRVCVIHCDVILVHGVRRRQKRRSSLNGGARSILLRLNTSTELQNLAEGFSDICISDEKVYIANIQFS